jgi:multidrug efflux pump subunit AcrA (membrane-fusion protein)
MKRKTVIIIASCIAGALLLFWMFSGSSQEDKDIFVQVKRGMFEINVFTTGELEAKNSVNINGPEGLRTVGIWQVKISDLVPEGTRVKKGDYIAALDKTEISNKIRDAESELQKFESQYNQTILDTALQLRQARDEMVNLEFTMKEKEIVLEQSQFEPPATVRQAQLDLDRSKRAHDQAKKNYKLKESQLKAKTYEVSASLNQAQNRLKMLTDLLGNFTIVAPEDGMLQYEREWNGRKKTVGSTIGAWDPTVATLPDLSSMISKTFVNEVDIRKVKIGQEVNVSLDAYPDKKLTGKITTVANVGEQNPKNDSKVFEVVILINEKDTTLRPAMTTGNNIIVGRLKDVLYIPLESIHNDGDTLTYVFLKDGLSMVKKEITTGETNEDHAVVTAGLTEQDQVYLSKPADHEGLKVLRLEKKPGTKPEGEKKQVIGDTKQKQDTVLPASTPNRTVIPSEKKKVPAN